MPSGLSPFTTATAYLDHLAPRQSRPVQRFVPTSALAETVSPTSPEASTSTTAQEDHASQSITHFPQVHGCTGFVNARVIHAGKTLELRWLNLVQAPLSEAQEEGEDGEDHRPYEELDAYGCLAPIHFHFPDPIISSPGIFTSPSTGELTINLLTKRWTVYRLRFPAPYLFCLPEDEDFQDGWATDHEVEEVLGGKTVMLVHPIDVDNLLVFLADGGVSLLRWGRLVGLNESYGWMSAVFASGGTGAWWQKLLSVPSLPSSHASLGGGQIDASPDAAVSVASALGDGGTGENGWAFSVARDRKLRIWNLATQACVGIKDLARSARSNNVADYALVPTSGPDTPSAGAGKRPTGPPLLPPVPRTLLRYVPADEGDDAAYEGFLVAFVPSLVAPVFVTYGVSLSRDRRTSELVLLEERDCSDLWARGERQGDLRDFGVAKVDPTVGVETPQEQRAWTLWTVWDEATTTGGPGNVIRFVPLTETRAWQTATPEPPGWTTISPPRTETWDPAFFDEALSDGTKGVPEVFLEYILKPGRYAPSTLKYALDTYSEPLYHDRSVSRSNAIDLDFSTVEERIAAVVGSTIRLETSPQTGTPLYDAFRKRLQGEWLRFTAMCEESRRAALWTVELALDDDRELAVLFGRACVALPVAREAAVALAEASEREPQALVVEGDPWPVLGESDAREDLVRLVTASSTLANSIPKDLLLGLEADLLQAVREPLTSSFDSIADSLASDALIAAVAEARDVWQSSAAAITDPQSGLKSLCQVVTSTELLRPPANIGVVTTSVLSQALIADSATVSIETRFDLTRNAALFLLVLREEDGVEADALPPLMGALFAALHALGTLRWITLQPTTATVSRTSLQGNEDSLADQLESLQMGDQTAAELSATSSAFSLLTSLMALSHSPGYVVSSPPPLALTHALSSFLESTGLLSERNTVTTTLADVVFVQQLVNMGLPELALAVIGMYPVNAGLKYLEGAARTALGQVEDAEDAFRKAACALYEDSARLDDDACLVPVLPIDCPSTPSGYYRHVATVFDEQAEADLAVAHFCELALSVTDDPQGQQLADRTAEELWARLFQAYSGLGLFEDAYKTLMRIPAEELKYACLRQLVQNMCEASQVDALLRFPFGDLQNKLEDALSWRARNSDPRSTPSYFGILYVYHSGRGDYRSAGTAMYQLGRKLAELGHVGENATEIWTQQCYAYLTAVNALSLVPAQHAWIPMPVPAIQKDGDDAARKRRRITYHIPVSDFTTPSDDVVVVTLSDIRQEYARTLAKLELVGDIPHLSAGSLGELDGDVLVPLLLSKGRVEDAFDKCLLLDVDMSPLFATLAERCTRVARDGAQAATVDQEWVHQARDAATWEGSLAARAWRLLQLHLDRHDGETTHWKYHDACLAAILETDRNVKIPPWLLTFFLDKRPEFLLRCLYRSDLLEDAFVVASMTIAKVNAELPTDLKPLTHADPTCLPLAAFDQLLNCSVDPIDPASLSATRLKERQAELRRALDEREGLVSKADAGLRRQVTAR